MSKETTTVENFHVILAYEGKQFALIKVNSKPLWECTNGKLKKIMLVRTCFVYQVYPKST